jgi:transposase-like protein
MYKSISFFEFQKKFSTDNKCSKYLFIQRWPQGFICPRCGHTRYSFHNTKILYQCSNCRYQTSLTAGTIFHETRTSLRKWFWMIFLIGHSKTGISILMLQKLLDIGSYKTAWTMSQKIRKAMADRDSQYKLAGLVEMDDSYYGAKNATGKRGRGADKKSKVVISVGLKNDRPTYASMQVVDAVSSDNIKDVANDKVEKGATIKTDGFPSYCTLVNEGFQHQREVLESPEDASNVLPWVHILIANSKSLLRGTHHGVSSKHLQRYLDSFTYIFNRRPREKEIFDRFLTACFSTSTITLAELRA